MIYHKQKGKIFRPFALKRSFDHNKDEIGTADVTDGYSQAEAADCFTREAKNKTAYLFLIDDNYYCEYFVDNSVSDKEAATKQLKNFCHEFSDIIVAAEGNS